MTDMPQASSQGIPSDHFDRTHGGSPVVERIVSDSGESSSSGSQLSEKRKRLGRIILLLAFAWIFIAWIVYGHSVMGLGLVFLSKGSSLVMTPYIILTQVLLVSARACEAIASMTLAYGPWTMTLRGKRLLRIAAAGFVLKAGSELIALHLMIVPFGPLANLRSWLAWPIWIIYAFALTTMIHAIGTCSRQDPGGRHRGVLEHAWIGITFLAAMNLIVYLTYGMIEIDIVISTLDIINFLWRIAFHGSLVLLVFFMIPWKRKLTRCAKASDSVGN